METTYNLTEDQIRDWADEEPKKTTETQDIQVVIKRIDLGFENMIELIVKAAIAVIPAGLILAVIYLGAAFILTAILKAG